MFASINALVIDSEDSFIIMGDMNAKVPNREILVKDYANMSFKPCKDNCNFNGEVLQDMCAGCNLLLLNNLKYNEKQFSDQLTFRKKARWVSQLDVCLISTDLIDEVVALEINQDVTLPSDHAIVTLKMCFRPRLLPIEAVLKRSKLLTESIEEKDESTVKGRRPIPLRRIDTVAFLTRAVMEYPPQPPDILDSENFEVYCEGMYKALYDISTTSISKEEKVWNTNLSRWSRLLESNDPKIIWGAINWKGDIVDTSQPEPSEQEFKNHFEKLLNHQNNRA